MANGPSKHLKSFGLTVFARILDDMSKPSTSIEINMDIVKNSGGR